MRHLTLSFLLLTSFFSIQAQNRQQASEEYDRLKQRTEILKNIILQPDKEDAEAALVEQTNVFRLLPRNKFDDSLSIASGGSYYSFTKKNHSPGCEEIGLWKETLSVGFAGANYGFISDFGEIPLSDISEEAKGAKYFFSYQPAENEPKARIEQRRVREGFKVDAAAYRDQIDALVGHTYGLRSINYDRCDVAVAFKIYRQDNDGSLIIFWKLLKQFEKPILNRPAEGSSLELSENVLKALQKKGFYKVTVDASTIPVTLRGTVPKGKLAEAIVTAQEAAGKPVRNEIIEQ